jgi:1-acyl-sn-glycerol-3-phosphate acyltransferase
MPVLPKVVRQLVVAPLVVLIEAGVVAASPVLAVVAAIHARLRGGRRALRALRIVVDFAARHVASTFACLGLWVAGGFGRRMASRRMERAHYAVMRWFVGGVYRSVTRWAPVDVRTRDSADAVRVLSARRSPVVVLGRHAGEGDSLLVLHEVLCRHRREPRIVLHEALRLDPLIDALGSRLPNRFLDPRGGDSEVEIAAMTTNLTAGEAVLIFPEGGNFSAARRDRGIERLEQTGHAEEAAWARGMSHVSAPRPGGTLAALDAAPDADVIVFGHRGMPEGARQLWQRLDRGQTVELRLWLVPAEEIPSGRDERIDWLFGLWRTLDAWIGGRPDD